MYEDLYLILVEIFYRGFLNNTVGNNTSGYLNSSKSSLKDFIFKIRNLSRTYIVLGSTSTLEKTIEATKV